MHFTQEDYRKIETWLYQRVVKDTELPSADPLNGTERIPIVQDEKNKTMNLNDFVKRVAEMKLPDFINVTTETKRPYLTLQEAVSYIPVEQRKLGLTITFHNEHGNWLIYQFNGTSLNQWSSINYWNNIIQQALEEFLLFPDEEDITGVRDGNRTFLKFKNRDYNPEEFSGMGMIILRKNLVGTEACSIDDEDHLNNILTQDMINQENTVYIVQYDFDLDGKVISIPKGCTLWFQGGSINNGSIYLQETAILGAFEFADMGDIKLFGKFNTGQVMTFLNDSYKAKTGKYFIPYMKPSSATSYEDAKNDTELFYDKNPNAYTTETRQELRWWNGEEWILILDITDYNELKAIIEELIEKHNVEMSACYKYFKVRCYNIEKRLDYHEELINNIQVDITNITNNIEEIFQNITNLENIINNLEQTIKNYIQEFIENNVLGVVSVTVNNQKFTPDENGNITLPDYPSGGGNADSVKGTLRFTGASTETYNGSRDVTVNIPEGGSGGGVADSVRGTLTVKSSDGTTLTTYNGSVDKTLTLPSGGGGGDTIITAKELLTLKQGNTTLGTYDGTEAKTITIPESGGGSSNITINDLDTKALTIKNQKGDTKCVYNAKEEKTLKGGSLLIKQNSGDTLHDAFDGDQSIIDLKPLQNGSAESPIILFCGYFRRDNSKSAWTLSTNLKHPSVGSITSEIDKDLLTLTVNSAQGWRVENRLLALANSTDYLNKSYRETYGNNAGYSGISSWIQCGTYSNVVYLHGWRKTDDNQQSVWSADLTNTSGSRTLGFQIVIFGYCTKQ